MITLFLILTAVVGVFYLGAKFVQWDLNRTVDREMEKVQKWREETPTGIFGTCDWGDCDRPANRIRDGLPVCDECFRKPEE